MTAPIGWFFQGCLVLGDHTQVQILSMIMTTLTQHVITINLASGGLFTNAVWRYRPASSTKASGVYGLKHGREAVGHTHIVLSLVLGMQGSLQSAQQEECGMDRMTEAGITYLRR